MTPPQRESFKARKSASVARNPEGRKRRALRAFNMTLERYEEMHAEQGGVCAICRLPEAIKRGDLTLDLSVDHDHACCPEKGRSCGKCVRALLCGNCNNALGKFQDDATRVRAAADYLERHATARQ